MQFKYSYYKQIETANCADLQFFFFTCQSGHEGSEKELKYTSAKGFLKIMVVQKKKTTFDHWIIFPFLEW